MSRAMVENIICVHRRSDKKISDLRKAFPEALIERLKVLFRRVQRKFMNLS
jgi:hypothetical protein